MRLYSRAHQPQPQSASRPKEVLPSADLFSSYLKLLFFFIHSILFNVDQYTIHIINTEQEYSSPLFLSDFFRLARINLLHNPLGPNISSYPRDRGSTHSVYARLWGGDRFEFRHTPRQKWFLLLQGQVRHINSQMRRNALAQNSRNSLPCTVRTSQTKVRTRSELESPLEVIQCQLVGFRLFL